MYKPPHLQLKNLTPKQISSLQLTSEQCAVLGLAPGQSLTLNHVSLISLNGDQVSIVSLISLNGDQVSIVSLI